jgi:hypothetical protein
VVQIQRAAKKCIARRNLKQLVKNSREMEANQKFLRSEEYFETTTEWLSKLIAESETKTLRKQLA